MPTAEPILCACALGQKQVLVQSRDQSAHSNMFSGDGEFGWRCGRLERDAPRRRGRLRRRNRERRALDTIACY